MIPCNSNGFGAMQGVAGETFGGCHHHRDWDCLRCKIHEEEELDALYQCLQQLPKDYREQCNNCGCNSNSCCGCGGVMGCNSGCGCNNGCGCGGVMGCSNFGCGCGGVMGCNNFGCGCRRPCPCWC